MKQFLLILSSLLTGTLIFSQQGSVDESFGDSGFVAGQKAGLVNSIAQQPDAKLLAAGGYYDFNGPIIRLLSDGSIDSSFGKDGAAISPSIGTAYDIILLNNKKILISGLVLNVNGNVQSCVARFTPNGKPDSSFGNNGICVVPGVHIYDFFSHIAVKADGSIIIGGTGYDNPNTLDSQYSVISRISADGIFDNSFGNNGYVLNLIAIDMKDLAIQADGKIVTAGYNFAGGNFGQDFVFSRYNADGTPDNSFGNKGNIVIDGDGGEDVPGKIIIQADGKLVVGGYSGGDKFKYYMSALRFNSDGSLDKGFGNAGKVFVDFIDSSGRAYDMVQQPDGKFILAGAAYDLQQTGSSFALCRISNDGKLDSSFGINGLQITPYPGGGEAYCATLQADNKIVLGGYYQTSEWQSFLMVRYNNSLTQKQILITKIRRWLQHHNGIEWGGNSSINSYVVQRSYDGIHFSSIAKIHAGNNTVYTYADPSPLSGNNYYRLQITSVNGAVNYSNVLAVTNSNIKISPNPATNSLHIEDLPNQKVQLSVVDFSGNVKLQTTVNSSTFNLNIASLKPGNYLLKIQSQDDVVTKSFVKE